MPYISLASNHNQVNKLAYNIIFSQPSSEIKEGSKMPPHDFKGHDLSKNVRSLP